MLNHQLLLAVILKNIKTENPSSVFKAGYVITVLLNNITTALVSVLASSQTKDIKIGICRFSSQHEHLGVREKTGRTRVRIMSLCKGQVFLRDCCIRKLAR